MDAPILRLYLKEKVELIPLSRDTSEGCCGEGSLHMLLRRLIAMLLLVLGVLLFTACEVPFVRQAVSCDQIAPEALRSLDIDEMNRERMLEWIHINYQLEDSAIARYDADTLAWEYQGNEYYAYFDQGELTYLRVWRDALEPTADEVIDCLGSPGLYRAIYSAHSVRNNLGLELWYVAEGIMVRHYTFQPFSQKQPPAITGNMRMGTVITFFQPDDPVAIAAQGIAPIPVMNPLDEHPLKPWPGSWEAIEIEINQTRPPQ
jgi:hypothetical protein